ncbi:uncharacterized protein ccdc33 [Neoarius graeffei]|uniref:uncharacterized protein ccdc33 n=1 Tax=Neoarius graeffei TaxID=443677 RepID=UPI00298D0ACE|nr:uncharacterized protein ccdc33 [Neoarius graeffei]
MLRNRIKIEEKKLEFVFEIENVQFNQPQQYRLMLTVENPLLAGSGSGIQLRVNNEEIVQANSVSTDTLGHEIISVSLHGATSLPLLTNGGVPLPLAIINLINVKGKSMDTEGELKDASQTAACRLYCVSQTGTEDDGTGQCRSQAVTHCTLQSTHNSCWEENLSVELVDVGCHREGRELSVTSQSPQSRGDPPESVFTLPVFTAQGQPQISPEKQPVWNPCFLSLGRDCGTAFTPGAALVALEYYPTATGQLEVPHTVLELDQADRENNSPPYRKPHPTSVRCESPLLSTALLLSSPLRHHTLLQAAFFILRQTEHSIFGISPVLIGNTVAVDGCKIGLRFRCGIMYADFANQQRNVRLQRDGYDLPAYDALAQILSEYQHIFKTPKAPQQSKGEPKEQKKSKRSLELNQTFEIHSPHERLPGPIVQDDDPHVAEITEHQTKELENYRSAMCKMAEDILALRSQVASLEEQNSQLRNELSMSQDLGRTLLDDTDIDVMTQTEIAERIVSLKCKLASESSKAADQRDKIQQLQNELIRKNDNEKELMRLKQVHHQQQAVLKRYQGQIKKLSNLEATVRQQEKVIERMEKVLTTKLRERNKENAERKKKVLKEKDLEESRMREVESILAAENSCLRAELERLRQLPQPVIIQQPAQQPFADSEKLRLLEQIERAEACIRTLGKQLEENARQWGKEKQDMLTRLSEYNHGFARASTLHHLPLKSVSHSVLGHIRHKQLDTLK